MAKVIAIANNIIVSLNSYSYGKGNLGYQPVYVFDDNLR